MTAATGTPPAALQARGLHLHYHGNHAVRGLDFSIWRGEVVGLLGLNGAGKSTALAMLAGALAPSAGSVRVDGVDLGRARRHAGRRVGYLPDRPPVYDDLTVAEFLSFCAGLRRVPAADRRAACERTMEAAGLGAVAGRRLGNLSKGYRQRAGIAQALVHSPTAVILDEPASGLDPAQRDELRGLLRAVAATGAGIVMSSHALADVQAVCSRVLVIHEGRLVLDSGLGPTGDIDGGAATGRHTLTVDFVRPPGAEALGRVPGVREVVAAGAAAHGRFTVTGTGTREALAGALASAALDAGWGLVEIAPGRASLERVFMDLVRGSGATAPGTPGGN